MSKKNKEIVRRFLTELQNKQNLDIIDELVSDDFIGRSAGVHGLIELKKVVSDNFSAFIGMMITIEDQASEGDLVFTRCTATGVHDGYYRGVAPTGEIVKYTVVSIHRIADGMITEGWRIVDRLDIAHQIGAVT
jgi:predicted ester cyclase